MVRRLSRHQGSDARQVVRSAVRLLDRPRGDRLRPMASSHWTMAVGGAAGHRTEVSVHGSGGPRIGSRKRTTSHGLGARRPRNGAAHGALRAAPDALGDRVDGPGPTYAWRLTWRLPGRPADEAHSRTFQFAEHVPIRGRIGLCCACQRLVASAQRGAPLVLVTLVRPGYRSNSWCESLARLIQLRHCVPRST